MNVRATIKLLEESIGRNLYKLGWQRHDLLEKKKKRLTGLDQNLKHVLQKNTIRKTKSPRLRKDI